jgi:subtilase family serine protease
MRSGWRGRILGCAGLAVASLGCAAPGALASQTSTGSTVIASTAPLAGATLASTAAAPAARPAEVHVFLGQDQVGLQALDEQVSDPQSGSYGQFLTPAQVAARFGASTGEIAAVDSWLSAQGLHVTGQSPYLVSATGPAASVAHSFDTTVVPSSAGQLTNATAMSMPSSLTGQVVTVTVTGTKAMPEKPKLQAASRETTGPHCSQYYGQLKATGVPSAYGEQLTWAPCGYTPNQLRSALFAKASGLTGQGVTVAIISGDNDKTAFADANVQASQDGFAPLLASQFIAYVEKGSQYGVGDVESAIDVEAVHATAPGATIAYVAGGKGESDDPTLNALEQIISQHLADVVTDSWGLSENFTTAIESAFTNALQRAGVEGITVDTASGDVGSNPPISYLFPASEPWLTTVGGTSLAIGSNSQYLWQTGWEDGQSKLHDGSWNPNPPGTFDGGSTGGVSTLFPEPYYQQGIVSGNVVGGKPMEVYPDVSDLADPDTGYSIAYTVKPKQGVIFNTWGGTSLASPLFAGTEADVIQGRHDAALGYANPTLYGFYGSQAFNDVTDTPQGAGVTEAVVFPSLSAKKTLLATLGQAQLTGLSAGPGFDDVTGIGSPSAQFYSLLTR